MGTPVVAEDGISY
jgi:hypothetical protein